MEDYPKLYLYKRIVQAKLFIDHHYAEKIDLDNIADEAHFSKFHFIRLFKHIYGRTPHHYLTQVRINSAKQLLTANVPIGEVCCLVGFESMTSFIGLFKRSAGVTPFSFQLQQRRRKTDMAAMPLKFIPNCFVVMHGIKK